MPQAKESLSSTDLGSGFVLAAPPDVITFTNEQLKATLRNLGKDASTVGRDRLFLYVNL